MIIDAQVHAWLPDSDAYPWDPAFPTSGIPADLRRWFEENAVSADALVGMMDEAGIDRALLTSPLLYGPDHRYAFDAARRYPERFGVVGPVSPRQTAVADYIAEFANQPSRVGIRMSILPGARDGLSSRHTSPLLDILTAVRRAQLPVFLSPVDMIDVIPALARAASGVQLVLDHVGLMSFIRRGPDRLDCLPQVLELARFENVAVKCSGLPELSREPYPYRDVWSVLERVIDRFGVHRTLWGSDITQHLDRHSYSEAVGFIKDCDVLSRADKAMVLGGSLCRLLGWPPDSGDG